MTAGAQPPGPHPARQRQDRRLALNPCVTFCEDPVRDGATVGRALIIDETAGQLLRRDMFCTCERGPGLVDRPCPDLLRDVLSDGVTVIAVDTAFALFMAIPVKVQPLLIRCMWYPTQTARRAS